MTATTRTESDSMGDIEVPADARYGAQTQRAINNFCISGRPMPAAFICSLGLIKAAAANTNARLGVLNPEIAKAISMAAMAIADGHYGEQFPVDIFQTGSGTSTNMNVNEVIASLASEQLKHAVHPNDHVNCSQSSNDVIPTAIHVSAQLALMQQLIPAIQKLQSVIKSRETELVGQLKTGRTHLMDAMPISLAQELSAWRAQLQLAEQRFKDCSGRLCRLAQGGTAVGTGINAPEGFAEEFCQQLSVLSNNSFLPADNLFAAISCQDTAVELSGQLNTLAVALMKIANDLRWMNSGPLSGLAEIQLKPLQPGSSIMPGKVNPVIPEAVAMAAAQVMGNHSTISVAGQSGNFQLNVMLPVIAANLLQSITLLAKSCAALGENCIADFTVNSAKLEENLASNPILATALNEHIGYYKAAEIAKQAYQQRRPIIEVAVEMTTLDEVLLRELLDPHKLV